MDRKHEKYEQLIARCKGLAPVPTAVAHPCDESSLKGAVEAAKLGILQPILVGPKAEDRSRGGAVLARPVGLCGERGQASGCSRARSQADM